jgi:uncharacterized protein (TIGR02996 family)
MSDSGADVGERLLAEIHAHPDDVGPRIVYADWLLEHSANPDDHARAELIHAQCGLSRAHPADVPTLEARATQLLKKHKRMWVASLVQANIRGNWKFRRGFLEGGTLSAERFVKHAPRLFELAPLLHAMVFPEASNELVGLSESPYLARLDDIDIHEMCRCGRCKIELELPVLFGSPHVANLKRLVASQCRIEPENARALFGSPHLENLRDLDLHDNRIDGRGLEPLVDRPRTFTRLILASNPLGTRGIEVLASARLLQIEELDLTDCMIDEDCARLLAAAPWADGIVKLTLHGNSIGKGAARAALRERYGNRLDLA